MQEEAGSNQNLCWLLLGGFSLSLPFDPEDCGSMCLQNISELLLNYTVVHFKSYSSMAGDYILLCQIWPYVIGIN
jgi:hypothetical protein